MWLGNDVVGLGVGLLVSQSSLSCVMPEVIEMFLGKGKKVIRIKLNGFGFHSGCHPTDEPFHLSMVANFSRILSKSKNPSFLAFM